MTTQLTPAQIAHMRAWVKALRSGKYKQGRDVLRYEDKFCCLGVACQEYLVAERAERIEVESWKLGGRLDGHDTDLPKRVVEWLGVKRENPEMVLVDGKKTTAIDMNDVLGYTFPQIADAIERTWPEVRAE